MKIHVYNSQGNKKKFDSCRMNRNILDMRKKNPNVVRIYNGG